MLICDHHNLPLRFCRVIIQFINKYDIYIPIKIAHLVRSLSLIKTYLGQTANDEL
jgi:hypothetical protein